MTAVFDSVQGLIYAAGDSEQFILLLSMFCNAAAKKRAELVSFKDADDLENYCIKVHALKSTSRGIGANTLADIAFEHEKESRAKNKLFVNSNWQDLITAWDQTLNEIRSYLEKNSVKTSDEPVSSAKSFISKEEENALLDGIKNDVLAFSFYDAGEKIKQLQQCILPESQQGFLNSLLSAVSNFDYIAAAEILGLEK